MASIQQVTRIHASAEHAWDALRDFGAVHVKLAPGFVVDAHLDTPGSRVVTFFDGRTAREVLVTGDDTERRLVYSLVGGRLTHHNAAAQSSPMAMAIVDSSGAPICCPTRSRRPSPP